jgi:hypothetical protein
MALVQTATNEFRTGLMSGSYDFNTDTFKIALYNNDADLNETTSVYTTANEVVASGYSAGGAVLTVSVTPTTGPSGDIAYVSFNNASWSGAISARGALIYDVTNSNKTVCVLDFGSEKTSVTTFEVQFPPATNTSAIIRVT